MAADIDIRIKSSFQDAGFARAIRAVNQLTREVGRVNSRLISATKGNGNTKGLTQPIAEATKALKQMNDANTKAQSSLGKTGQNATKAAEGMERLRAVVRDQSQSMTLANRAMRDFESAMRRGASADERFTRAKQAQLRAMSELAAAERELERIEQQGTVTQQERSTALTRYNEALNRAKAAQKEFSAAQREQDQANAREADGIKKLIATRQQLKQQLEQLDAIHKQTGKGEEQYYRTLEKLEKVEKDLLRIRNMNRPARDESLIRSNKEIERTIQLQEKAVAGRARLAKTVEDITLREKASAAATKAAAQAQQVAQRAQQQAANVAAKAQQQAGRAAAQAQQQAAKAAQLMQQRMQAAVQAVQKLAASLSGVLAKAAGVAANALGKLNSSAGSRFAQLRAALDSTGRVAQLFGRNVEGSMTRANAAIERTAAGWSLIMSGSMVRGAGMRVLTGGGLNFSNYMEYERAATRAAIATESNMPLIQQIAFGIQRGQMNGQSIGAPIYNLSATDIAQGAYFYGSALGLPITQSNSKDIATSLSPMLQLAAFSGTDPEQTIKGVLNAVMEFGVDPRQKDARGGLANAPFVAKTSALYGFLANATSMEVQDITEFFKMVGPLARIAVGGDTEKALKEVMGFSWMASEYGLRGSSPGRGLAQLLTSIYDPTDKANSTAQRVWGKSLQDVFLDKKGNLKGGIAGLFQPFLEMSDKDWITAQAEIFTNNASRALIPLIQQARIDPGKWEGVLAQLSSGDVEKLLENATTKNMDTIAGSVKNLQNMWFQLTTSIVDSIKGPIKSALNTFANIFAELSDIINRHPIIGKFLAGLTALVGVLATVIGTMLSAAGVILIMQRAFMFTHGAGSLLFGLLTAIPHVLALGLPIMLAVAAAALILKKAWDLNVMGVQDFVKALQGNFSKTVQERILPAISGVIVFLQRAGTAFSEFVNGILLGFGPTNNLGAMLESVFGSLLGPRFYAKLLQLQGYLGGVRESVIGFFRDARGQLPNIRDVHGAFKLFFEEVILGFSEVKTRQAANNLGRALGIDNLGGLITRAAGQVRRGLSVMIGAWNSFRDQISKPLAAIKDDILKVFTVDTLNKAISTLKSFAAGFIAGFAGTILATARAFQFLADQIARAGDAGRWISDQTQKWLGFRTTLEGVGAVAGVVFGVIFAGRLLATIGPISAVIGMATKLSLTLLEVGVRAVLSAGQLAFLGVQAVATGLKFLFAQSLMLGLAGVLALVAVGIVGYIAATKGLGAAIDAAVSIANGFMAVMSRIFAILLIVGGIVYKVASVFLAAIAPVLGFKDSLEALGAVIALLIGRWLAVELIGALAKVSVALGLSGLGFNKFTLAIGGIAVAIALLGPHFDTLFGWFNKLNDMTGGYLDEAAMAGMLIGPKNSAKGVGKLGQLVIGLATKNPYLALAAVGIIGGIAAYKQTRGAGYDGNSNAMLMDQYRAGNYAFPPGNWENNNVAWTEREALMLQEAKKRYKDDFSGFDNWYKTSYQTARTAFATNLATKRQFEFIKENGALPLDVQSNDPTQSNYVTPATMMAYSGINPIMYKELGLGPVTGVSFKPVVQSLDETNKAAREAEGRANKTWEEVKGVFKTLGIGQTFEQFMDMIGIDPSKGDFNPDKFFSNTAFAKFDPAIKKFLGPELTKYLDDYEKYQQWQDTVAKMGFKNAQKLYQENNIPIPKPPTVVTDEVLKDIDDAIAKEQEAEGKLKELAALNDQITQAMQQGMSLPQALAHTFDLGKGGYNFASLPTAMGMFADQISANIPEGATWSNIYEGIADTVGMGGVDFSQNMLGKNVHTALRNNKGFQNWAAEMGISIDEALKGVPKFVHAEQYVPQAFAGITAQFAKLPDGMYEKMDHLGAEMGKVGIEWKEVAEFAVGKAMKGEDWNLVDYIAEAWDMSVEEATQYMLANGIDPTRISSKTMGDLELSVQSMGGKVNVFTPEWYDWFNEVTKGGTDKIIEITKEQFGQIPDAIKLSLSAMGYSFVVGGEQTANDARASYEAIKKTVEETYGKLGKDLGRYKDDAGNEWVKTTDALGKPIDVPAPTYDAYKSAIKELIELNQKVRDSFMEPKKGYDQYIKDWKPFGEPLGDGTGGGTPLPGVNTPLTQKQYDVLSGGTADYIPGGKYNPLPAAPATTPIPVGLPPLTDYSKYGEQANQEFVKAFTGGGSGGAAVEAIKPETLMSLDSFSKLGADAKAKFLEGFSGASASPSGPVGDGTGNFGGQTSGGGSGPFDAIFEGYAVNAVEKFRTKVNELMPQAVGMLSMYGIQGEKGDFKAGGGGGGPFDAIFEGYAKSAVEKFRTTINAELPKAVSGAGGEEGLKPTLTLNVDDFMRAAAAAFDMMRSLDAQAVDASASLNVDTFMIAAAAAFSMLRALDVATANPTVGVIDNAAGPLATIWNLLTAINGFVATASITTTQTTVVQTVNGGTVVGRAKGGYVNERFTLVGENGPELVSFGQGAFVHTASETSQMLRGLSATRQPSGGGVGGGDQIVVQFNGDNHFYNDTDVDTLVDRIQYLIGKENRKAQRGMVPVDMSALHNPN